MIVRILETNENFNGGKEIKVRILETNENVM